VGKSAIRHVLLLGVLPLSCAGFVALTANAQTNGDTSGGVQLTFGVSQRFETADNRALDVVSAGRTNQSATQLSFGATSETRVSSLAFNLSTTLRYADTPDDGSEFDVEGPQASLKYARNSANAAFALNASLREQDVEFLRPLEDFLDADGNIDLPEDLDDLTGTGTRRSYGLNATLDWGTAGPLGFGVSAGLSALEYSDTTSPGLIDNRRSNLGATVRLRLSGVTSATAELRFSRFDEQDTPTPSRDTITTEVGLTHTLPAGSLTASVTSTDTEEGNRLGFRIGRNFDLPDGTLSASIGATRDEDDETNLTGTLSLSRELPRGQINAQLRRSVASGNDDTTRVLTLISAGYTQTLTPLSSLELNMSYGQSETPGTNVSTADTSLSATYTRSLTEDWGLDLGVSHRVRDSDTSGKADSTSVFLSLNRTFEFRP
jgi:hypothetical protein